MSATRNRTVLLVGGVLAALLVAVLVVGVIILNEISQQAEADAYRACMATMGVGPSGTVTDIDEMVEAAEFCSR